MYFNLSGLYLGLTLVIINYYIISQSQQVNKWLLSNFFQFVFVLDYLFFYHFSVILVEITRQIFPNQGKLIKIYLFFYLRACNLQSKKLIYSHSVYMFIFLIVFVTLSL